MAWGGRKDVHSGTLCRDTTRGDGGRAEPPGGGEALWRSPQWEQTLILVRHHIDVRRRSSRRSTRGRAEKPPPIPARDACRLTPAGTSSAHWRVRKAAWPSLSG